MSTSPINALLSAVEWEELPPMADDGDGLPHATHRGVLHIAGSELECFILSNGQRIFSAESIERFFGFAGDPTTMDTPAA